MKKSLVIVALASVALFSACQKEDVKIQSTRMQAVIAQDSKTDLDGLKVTWSAGDAFAVWNAGAKAGTYTLTSGAGTNQGSFEGTGAADGYIAVYPASSNLSTDYSSALANQTFGSNINGNLPMVGTISDGATKATFNKPLLGVVRLNLTTTEELKAAVVSNIKFNLKSKSNWVAQVKIANDGAVSYAACTQQYINIAVGQAIGDGLTVDVVFPLSYDNYGGFKARDIEATITLGGADKNITGKSILVEPGKVTTIDWNVK